MFGRGEGWAQHLASRNPLAKPVQALSKRQQRAAVHHLVCVGVVFGLKLACVHVSALAVCETSSPRMHQPAAACHACATHRAMHVQNTPRLSGAHGRDMLHPFPCQNCAREVQKGCSRVHMRAWRGVAQHLASRNPLAKPVQAQSKRQKRVDVHCLVCVRVVFGVGHVFVHVSALSVCKTRDGAGAHSSPLSRACERAFKNAWGDKNCAEHTRTHPMSNVRRVGQRTCSVCGHAERAARENRTARCAGASARFHLPWGDHIFPRVAAFTLRH